MNEKDFNAALDDKDRIIAELSAQLANEKARADKADMKDAQIMALTIERDALKTELVELSTPVGETKIPLNTGPVDDRFRSRGFS